MSRITPWQTVGPYFHYSLPGRGCADLTGQADIGDRPDLFLVADHRLPRAERAPKQAGEAMTIKGMVRDREGRPVPDVLLEIWQADPKGVYADGSDPAAFIGFGRAATGLDGAFEIHTLKPGATADDAAPHIAIGVLGTGITTRMITRIYFEGDPHNDRDVVLKQAPAARRSTLLATQSDGAWRHDIVLSGDGETVFFRIGT